MAEFGEIGEWKFEPCYAWAAAYGYFKVLLGKSAWADLSRPKAVRCFHRRVGRELRQTEDTIARDGTAYF